MTFLLSEDAALRNLLLGMTVIDQKANNDLTSRSVKVYFGQPDQEIRDQSYPYITIDMIDVAEDFSRAHRGLVKPGYLEDPTTSPSGSGVYDETTQDWYIHWPIPVNIDYQVTTYARQPRHDRQILAQMLTAKIPMRFATLETDDNTVRRLDLLDVSKRDVTEAGKRLFVNAFTVRVSSEITSATYNQVYKTLQVIGTGTTGDFVQGDVAHPFTAVESWTHTAPQ
jgi:hypothetical protein